MSEERSSKRLLVMGDQENLDEFPSHHRGFMGGLG